MAEQQQHNVTDGGADETMREDTAKATRGANWALISVGGFVVIAAILFLVYFISSAVDNKPSETPGQIANRTGK